MIKKALILILLCIMLTGCGRIFNPYASEFRCQNVDNEGKCISTVEAYNESKEGNPSTKKTDTLTPEEVYNKNRFKLMTDLVQDPTPPVVIPSEVVRILILPYTDTDNSLYDMRFSYFFATAPKWQFSIGNEEE